MPDEKLNFYAEKYITWRLELISLGVPIIPPFFAWLLKMGYL